MLTNKIELITDLEVAIKKNKGFAIGKIGFSEQCLLGYLPFLKFNPSFTQLKAYESVLRFHCEKQFGVFPTDEIFLKHFAVSFVQHLLNVDILGLFGAPQEKKIIKEYNITAKLINYRLTEPDQSIPENPSLCYLPLFKHKKILLVAPFANLLKQRATREIYEKVWSKINKKWFMPDCISAVEFPYSYITETKTHDEFGNVLKLFKSICDKINKQDFDIALIAAGALGIPITSYIKNINKIGISLGGHLQVMFGVAGNRWKSDAFYQENYLNEFWVDMPTSYHPANKEILTDSGAYW